MVSGGNSAGQQRDKKHSEYGGGPGDPDRREDGSAVPLETGEQARMLRMVGLSGADLRLADADGPEFEAAKAERELDEFWGIGEHKVTPGEFREQERRRLKAQSNDYANERTPSGDSIS